MKNDIHLVRNPRSIISYYSSYNNIITVGINKDNCAINEAIPSKYVLILIEENSNGIHEFLINGHTTYIGVDLEKIGTDEKYMELLFSEVILKKDFIDYIKGKTDNTTGFYAGVIKEEKTTEGETVQKLKQMKKTVLTMEQQLNELGNKFNELEKQEDTYLKMISDIKNKYK